jgi:predicted  nucleic acid-binding Zn-ribbon protein
MLDIHRELRELCERQGEALKKLAAERDAARKNVSTLTQWHGEAQERAADLEAQLEASFATMRRISAERDAAATHCRDTITAMAEELKRAPRGNAVHRALMIAREALEGGQTWPEANEQGGRK